ncbi:MAG: FUN14 domain-containing protein [Nitrososphaeraceae archaeon]
MATTTIDDTAMRFLIALLGGPMMGWALGYFIRKSIKVIAFIGGMFFFIIVLLYYIKTIDSLSVLQRGVEDAFETSVNRTIDISNQVLAKSGGDLSIPLFVSGFIVGFGLGLNNGRSRKSRLVIED